MDIGEIMFKIVAILMVTSLWSNLSYAYSFTEKEIKIVKESVISLCKTADNNHIKISEAVNAKTVLLKDLVEMDFGGEAEFTKTEWSAIEPLLPSKTDSSNYTKCIAEVTPIFMDKFSRQYEEETNVDM